MTAKKIQSITLKNFKAFYGEPDPIDFDGKNLLIYGENGSGKSSLARALELTLKNKLPSTDKNIFAKDDKSFVKVVLGTDEIKNATAIDGHGHFLDHKKMSDIHNNKIANMSKLVFSHFLQRYTSSPVYQLADALLPNSSTLNKGSWLLDKDINEDIKNELRDILLILNQKTLSTADSVKYWEFMSRFTEYFNGEVATYEPEFQQHLSEFCSIFYTDIELEVKINASFTLETKQSAYFQLVFNIKYRGQNVEAHNLNEARLSAISLSFFFAVLKVKKKQITSPNALKILILDDALTGLDMSNRLPVVKILKEHFDDYQIFFLTHDREFYERIGAIELEGWKKIEMYEGHDEQNESIFVPVVIDTEKDFNPIDKANKYFRAHDYPASANYLRKAFEAWVNDLLPKPATQSKSGDCVDKEKKKPGLEDKINELSSLYSDEHCNFVVEQDKGYYVDKLEKLKKLRTLILNPASHYDITAKIYKSELKSALDFYKKAEADLSKIHSAVSEDVCMLYVPYRFKKGSLLCYQFKKTIEEGLDSITVTYDAQYELVGDTWLHLNIEKQKYIDENTKVKLHSFSLKQNGQTLAENIAKTDNFNLHVQPDRIQKYLTDAKHPLKARSEDIRVEDIRLGVYTVKIGSNEIPIIVNFTEK